MNYENAYTIIREYTKDFSRMYRKPIEDQLDDVY